MSYDQKVLEVFVASPGDVAEERAMLEPIVAEINQTWARHLGVRLELVKWETHARPGVGTDAQAVINSQIPDDYDVFIGIFWSRLGTPTARAESGTVEEAERALERYRKDPTRMQVMFYFSDAALEPSAIDVEQFGRLQEFKRRLRGDEGALTRSYKTKDEFATLLRTHLSQVVRDWKGEWPAPTSPGQSSSPAREGAADPADETSLEASSAAVIEHGSAPREGHESRSPMAMESQTAPAVLSSVAVDEQDEGLLELNDVATEQFQKVSEFIGEITAATEALGTRTAERGEAIRESSADPVRLKHQVNQSAADLEEFADVVEQRIPVFAEAYSKALNTVAKLGMISVDFGEAGVENVRSSVSQLEEMKKAVAGSRAGLGTMRQSISGVPRLTTRFTHARNRAVHVLERWDGELANAVDLSERVQALLRGVLEQAQPSSV